MKNLIKFSFLILLFIGCKNKSEFKVKNEIQDLTLNAEIIDVGWSNGFECNWPTEYLFVKIILKNDSNVPKSFWIMKCSWQESFITDADSIEFLGRECLSNFPIQKELKPNQSLHFTSIIKVSKSSLKYKEFKIGFKTLSEKALMHNMVIDSTTRTEYPENTKTYWSNSLPLKPRILGFQESDE